MRVAIDINGTIVNVIEAESVHAAQALFPDTVCVEADGIGIGWVLGRDGYEAPPPPIPTPRPLTQLEFIRLIQSAGGVTNQELVAADADPNLAAWWIMFRLAQDIRLDDPTIVEGLAGLVSLDYITEAERLAVIAQWPTQ